MKRKWETVVYITLVNIATATDCKAARNTLVGTWKLNLAKSSWGKIPAPKEDTLVVTEDDAKGLKWTASSVSADGESFSYSFEGAADGREYPMKSPNNEAVMGSLGPTAESVQHSKQPTRRTARSIQTSTTTVSNENDNQVRPHGFGHDLDGSA